jgi:MFS family permease
LGAGDRLVTWSVLPDISPLRESAGFRAMFTSRTVAFLGSQAGEVAILVQAQRLTGSPLVVGTLGLAELVPLIVFGLYGGVLADRFDRRKLMVWCEPGLAACAGLLLVNSLLPHPPLWPLYVVAALLMAFVSLQRPAFEAAIPRLVPLEKLTQASAVMSLSTNASVLIGSSLGGVLAAAPGPWLVYALDVAGYAGSFAMLRRLPALPPITPGADGAEFSDRACDVPGGEVADGEVADGDVPGSGPDGAGPASRASALSEILVGLRYAVSRRDLLGSYLADLSAMIFAYPSAMLPFLAVELHAPWSTGLLFAAPSMGALVVSATGGWMPRIRRHGLAIAVSAGCWGLAMAAVGVSPALYAALFFLTVAGGADECSAIFRDTMWKQSIPDHLRGRMAGIELLSYAAGPPTGQLRSGAVAAVTSPRFSLTSGGLACVAAVAAVLAVLPAFRRYVAPAGATPGAPAGEAAGQPAGEPPTGEPAEQVC